MNEPHVPRPEGVSEEVTAFKLVCFSCKLDVFITQKEYNLQMDDVEDRWFCPRCGSYGVKFDDNHYRAFTDEAIKAAASTPRFLTASGEDLAKELAKEDAETIPEVVLPAVDTSLLRNLVENYERGGYYWFCDRIGLDVDASRSMDLYEGVCNATNGLSVLLQGLSDQQIEILCTKENWESIEK